MALYDLPEKKIIRRTTGAALKYASLEGESLPFVKIKARDFVKEQYQIPSFLLWLVLTISSSTCCLSHLRRIETSKQMSSEARNKDEFALEVKESKHQQQNGLGEIHKHEFLRLLRIRDFLSLILTYPMTMPEQHLLRKWRDDAQILSPKYFEHTDSVGLKLSGAYRWMHLLSEKPLKNMEVIIPNDILSKIGDGQRFIFSVNASASKSKGKQVIDMTSVHNAIPDAILNLAADLAVDQLIQTLVMCNIHRVRFSTRNNIETIAVMKKIKAALKNEHKENKINNNYSKVLWVDISKYQSNMEVLVQQEIAQQLNLIASEGDQIENNLTTLIEEEMMRMNHLVFLVDGDGNGKVDLQKVGFPTKMLAGVMVLLTIESSVQELDELTMAMELEIRTEDHILPWELFCRNVSSELIRSSSAICSLAVQIVEECGGHLLAIILVARWLKNIENIGYWKHALERLHQPSRFKGCGIPVDLSNVMFNAFAEIFIGLNDNSKFCLACSLYILRIKEKMADHLLISSWVCNRLVNSQEEAKHVLRDLVDRSILLQLDGWYIQWPEETYVALVSILKLNVGELGLNDLLATEEWCETLTTLGRWFKVNQINLIDKKLSELLLFRTCHWKELSLKGNADLLEIPPSFFTSMPQLKALDLSYTSLRSLPSSIFDLKELTELRLQGCKRFMELPPEIGQLENLKTLDLGGTPITHIPEQIQELTNLKTLILSFCKCHENIDHDMNSMQYPMMVPAGVISKLTALCYLSIDVSPDDKRWDENIQVILQDISELRDLKTVSLYIPRVEFLKDVRIMEKFRFIVGGHMERIISRAPPTIEAIFKQSECRVKFVNGLDIPNDINKVLKNTRALFLERHRTIKHLSEFKMENLSELQLFIVGECNEMQTLVDERCPCKNPLSCLKFLYAFYMSNLRSICQVQARFQYLKTIAFHTCPMLTTIFTFNFLRSLDCLEELIVEDCPKVSTLITHGSSEPTESIFLPRLGKLWLLSVPELVSISSGLSIGPRLERVAFYDCPKLQSLSKMELGSQYLKEIKAEKDWWNALKWDKAEWGNQGRPKYLDEIFSQLNEEDTIMDQLVENENESSTSHRENDWVKVIKIRLERLLPLVRESSRREEMAAVEGRVISCHTVEAWNEQLQKGNDSKALIVVDFTASWCGPGRSIARFLAELAENLPSITFLKVDVDELKSVAKDWAVRRMPTFVFLKEGKILDIVEGANKDKLQLTIAKHISAASA